MYVPSIQFFTYIFTNAFLVSEEDVQAFQEQADQEEEEQALVRRSERLKDKTSNQTAGDDGYDTEAGI